MSFQQDLSLQQQQQQEGKSSSSSSSMSNQPRISIKQQTSSGGGTSQRGDRVQGRVRRLTTQIRKQKKAQLVSLKRRCGPHQEQIHQQSAFSDQKQQQSPTQQQRAAATTPFLSNNIGTDMALQKANKSETAKVDRLSRLASDYVTSATNGSADGTTRTAMLLHQLQEELSSSDVSTSACADALLRPTGQVAALLDSSSTPLNEQVRMEAEQQRLEQVGIQLANALASSLTNPHSTMQERLDASRILTNLAAGESFLAASSSGTGGDSIDEDVDDIYGGGVNARSWCSILTTKSRALDALIQIVKEFAITFRPSMASTSSPSISFVRSTNNLDAAAVVLCEQCCWALGNIAGDSQRSRFALIQHDGIRPLICALRIAFLEASSSSSSSSSSGNNNPRTVVQTAGLCRNATWALCNLLRGGVKNSALPFLEMSVPNTSTQSEATQSMGPLFLPQDITSLVAAPEMVQSNISPTVIDPDDEAMCSPLLDGEINTLVSWDEIALEACWLLSFLTAKEDESVGFLCQSSAATTETTPGVGQSQIHLFDAITIRTMKAISDLAKTAATYCGGGKDPLGNDISSSRPPSPPTYYLGSPSASQICIPCIRILGNIATASNGVYGAQLAQHSLQQRSKGGAGGSSTNIKNETLPYPSLMDAVATLLRLGSSPSALSYNDFYNYGTGGEVSIIATEAAWAVGSLLCDVGQPLSLQHPANMIGPILVPALCDAMVSPNSSLPLKREALSAILNVVCAPPFVDMSVSRSWIERELDEKTRQQQQQQLDLSSRPIRREVVSNLVQVNGFIPCLVQLLSSTDMEVVLASVRLVDQMFRLILIPPSTSGYDVTSLSPQEQHMKRKFDECHLVDQLELICDKASGMYSASRIKSSSSSSATSTYLQQNTNLASLAADVAAELIDDYYSEDDFGAVTSDDQQSEAVAASITPMTTSGGSTFAFGVPPSGAFGIANPGAFSAGPTFNPLPQSPSVTVASPTNGMGRGRGRGKNIPAWMKS